jgi:hypothetical protein
MTDSSQVIAQLQSQWRGLQDLDRAQAIKAIQRLGVRLRDLAAKLNCSSSLLSYLLRASEAPLEDLAAARRGELSTRALVQRSRESARNRDPFNREAVAFEVARDIREGSQLILKWLEDQDVPNNIRCQVLEVAGRRELSIFDRPKSSLVAYLVEELTRWSFHVIPDQSIHREAFQFALEMPITEG